MFCTLLWEGALFHKPGNRGPATWSRWAMTTLKKKKKRRRKTDSGSKVKGGNFWVKKRPDQPAIGDWNGMLHSGHLLVDFRFFRF